MAAMRGTGLLCWMVMARPLPQRTMTVPVHARRFSVLCLRLAGYPARAAARSLAASLIGAGEIAPRRVGLGRAMLRLRRLLEGGLRLAVQDRYSSQP